MSQDTSQPEWYDTDIAMLDVRHPGSHDINNMRVVWADTRKEVAMCIMVNTQQGVVLVYDQHPETGHILTTPDGEGAITKKLFGKFIIQQKGPLQ